MFKLQIQFQKLDRYNNPIFIARPTDSVYEELISLSDKLEKYNEASKPIYHNQEYDYITLRTVKDKQFAFKEKSIYDITIKMTHKKTDEKDYINAILIKSKLIQKHIEDLGEDIVF